MGNIALKGQGSQQPVFTRCREKKNLKNLRTLQVGRRAHAMCS